MFNRVWSLAQVSRVVLVATLLAVSALALWPSPESLVTTGWDKANHFIAFFVLLAMLDFSWPRGTSMWVKVLILLAYGLAIELVQAGIAQRFASFWDLAADAVGLSLYLLLHHYIRRLEFLFKLLPFIENRAVSEWQQ